ncbi:GAF and ANTAR domain-containing protein [Kribbella albertanoniae]|uniref:ANTAR domain-containing protein n=1 Tax=Kribbella albertanoniae TaxID=1266829 RepID=A0A4R4PM26_9ACTN|nr:GAF and ANTAR domain-containing protein [Kribbella albertanoniae]TDC23162.1 ANTAR domain-containing protein [Kribbella albertanoniae]
MSVDYSSAEAFARLASELQTVDGIEETVEAVVQFALQALSCKFASVVLIAQGRRPEVVASTDPVLAELYQEQIDAGAGPLLTAIVENAVVQLPDVSAETRWSPELISRLTALGIHSAVHLPLMVSGRSQAVLNLYGETFSPDDLAVAHILARHASIAIASARHQETMLRAVDARKLVGQAMGILMERYDLDGDRAFEVLRRYSQDYNRKLRDVAQELIDTRKLPGRDQT